MVVRGRDVEESFMRSREVKRFGWPKIKDMSCNRKSFGPILRRHGSVQQKRADDVVCCSDSALSFTILGRGIRTRKMHSRAKREYKGAKVGIVKFSAVVALDSANDRVKMSAYIGMIV